MGKMIHMFDGEEHRWVEDPVERRREVRRAQVAQIREESAPELSPDGKVHNDFTVWLALENARESMRRIGSRLEACGT